MRTAQGLHLYAAARKQISREEPSISCWGGGSQDSSGAGGYWGHPTIPSTAGKGVLVTRVLVEALWGPFILRRLPGSGPSLGWGEEPWGVGWQLCHQQSQQLTAEACSHASQKDSSITFQRWECKLVQPLWKTAWRCRRGKSIPTPCWNGFFHLLSVAFIFIITHNGLPQRALHLCLLN